MFSGSSDKEFYEILDAIYSEYTKFNHKNDPFESNEFIWSVKAIRVGNIHLRHQKYYLPSTKVLGVIYCRLTSKIIWIGSSERSWVYVKKSSQAKYQL